MAFCAAGRGFVEQCAYSVEDGSRMAGLPPWRAGVWEIQADAVAAGTWVTIADVLAGLYVPAPGDAAIYWRGTPESGNKHIDTVVTADADGYIALGANERGGRWNKDNAPVAYTHPRLLGFCRWVPPAGASEAHETRGVVKLPPVTGVYTEDVREVPAAYTPMAFVDIAATFAQAFTAVTGAPPIREVLCLLLAQSALETGQWKKCHNYNVGHLKAGSAYPGSHTYYRCNELFSTGLKWFDPPAPECRFRAYPDALTAVVEHLRFLSEDTNHDGKNRYAAAWKAALAANASQFVAELAAAGYYTAAFGPYRDGVVALYAQFQRDARVPPRPEMLLTEALPEVPTLVDDRSERYRFGPADHARIRVLVSESMRVDWDDHIAARDAEMEA
jgi:hypothetical protein